MINPEPLMFIDSAKTLNQNKNQVVYDSRYKPIKKEEPIKVINQEVLLKIDGIIELYQKVKQIVCDIVASNNNYQGIPYSKDEEYLYIKQNGEEVILKLEDIEEIKNGEFLTIAESELRAFVAEYLRKYLLLIC